MVSHNGSTTRVSRGFPWLVLFLWIIALVSGLIMILQPERINSLVLIIAGAGCILLVMWVCTRHESGMSLLNPVVFLALYYYLLQFILMPLIIYLDWNSAAFLPALGNKAIFYFNLALVVGIGSLICLGVGYLLPFGRILALHLPSLNKWDWSPKLLGRASFAMYVLIGIPVIIFQISSGQYSYSGATNVNTDTIAYFLGFFRTASLFLIWFCYWRTDHKTALFPLSLVTAMEIGLAVIRGSRSALLIVVMVILMSYITGSKKHISMGKVLIFFGPIVAVALLAGVLLGTEFRDIKINLSGIETESSLSQTIDYSILSGERVMGMSLGNQLDSFSTIMKQRLDSFDNLGIILAYADKFKIQEKIMGMSNNILNELFWSFIPRALYPEKPVIGNIANKYAILYTGSGPYQNAAITAMGDLYRNFGMIGVAVGMAIIGILMRIMFVWLNPINRPNAMPAMLYSTWLLFTLGLESNYSGILTTLPRIGIVMVIIFLVLRVFMEILSINRKSRRDSITRSGDIN